MPKINKEEYEVLKKYNYIGVKWISRNENGNLVISKVKPDKIRGKWLPNCPDEGWSELRNSHNYLFKFIQSSDPETYSIAELIEEYGSSFIKSTPWTPNPLDFESEDIGMKKDIEWLKKEISTEMIELELIRRERWADVKYQTLRSVTQKLNQLDEPEVLSQEWVDNNSVYASHDGVTEEYVHVDDLQSLLVPTISKIETVDITEGQIMDWLDDNEFYHHTTAETVLANAVDKGELGYYGTKYSVVKKPVIPKYVADWIESLKSNKVDLLEYVYGFAQGEDINNYMRKQGDVLLRAWLDGYTVEEESLYYALVKGHELVTDEGDIACKYWNLRVPTGDVLPNNRYSRRGEFVVKMSKSEWNKLGINDSNADFVEVEE